VKPKRPRRERGSVSVELVIVAPMIGLLLLALIAVGRVQSTRADVESAARSAARELARSRDPHANVAAVQRSMSMTLDAGSPRCRTLVFEPSIHDATVEVTVSCTTELQETAALPIPLTITIAGHASEVRDIYREDPP
jgi:Flp pilus assembly protein TadG